MNADAQIRMGKKHEHAAAALFREGTGAWSITESNSQSLDANGEQQLVRLTFLMCVLNGAQSTG